MQRSLRYAILAVITLAVGAHEGYARTPMTRTAGFKSSGSREDISVPFLNTGSSAFGAYSVAPIIFSSPIVDDGANPQTRPVFNLIFYGAEQSFGGRSNGAALRR